MVKLIKNTNRNYTNISNKFAGDKSLSWKAKGIFLYLWSQANNWQFFQNEIAKHATDGADSLRKGLDELTKAGYLKRVTRHKKDGSFNGLEWVLSDDGHAEKPDNGENKEKAKKKSENSSNGKNKEKRQKRLDLPQSGKDAKRETRKAENRTLTNINSNNYQKKQLSKETNIKSGKPENLSKAKEIKTIIAYLNDKTGKHYKPTTQKTKECINARINEGFKVDDFKTVIDNKVEDWGDDEKMSRYLRPETLFGNKFEGYLNEGTSKVKNGGFPDYMMGDLGDKPMGKGHDEPDDDNDPFKGMMGDIGDKPMGKDDNSPGDLPF